MVVMPCKHNDVVYLFVPHYSWLISFQVVLVLLLVYKCVLQKLYDTLFTGDFCSF